MIDKNKAYRFKGDSERWHTEGCFLVSDHNRLWGFHLDIAEHLHNRGILLEYPELPGDDWEFCEREQQEKWLGEPSNSWNQSKDDHRCPSNIYCRKKKPVITEVEYEVERQYRGKEARELVVYIDPGFAGPGDKVKVTKL